MPDIKISDLLPAVTPLSGAETLPIVQNGDTVKATTQSIASLFSLGYTAENVTNKSTDASFAGATNLKYPSQLAVKTYVDNTLGNSGWLLNGNSGTTASNFIGTLDSKDLVLKTNNTEVLRFNNVSTRADFKTSIFATTSAGSACAIWAQSGSGNGYAIIGSNSTDKGFFRISNGTADCLIKGGNLSGPAKTLQLPNANGELVVSVNGVAPVNGNVIIPAGNVQQVKVSLTSANILSLGPSTPFILIPAPGAGKYIEVLAITGKYTFNTTAYSGSSALTYRIGQSLNLAAISLGTANNVLNQTFNVFHKLPPFFSTTATDIENQPLIIDAGIGTPTLGNGTLDVYITYSVVTL